MSAIVIILPVNRIDSACDDDRREQNKREGDEILRMLSCSARPPRTRPLVVVDNGTGE